MIGLFNIYINHAAYQSRDLKCVYLQTKFSKFVGNNFYAETLNAPILKIVIKIRRKPNQTIYMLSKIFHTSSEIHYGEKFVVVFYFFALTISKQLYLR